jgi:naphthalene 1,2-dioxygenase system ferredoxin subunit
MPWFPTVSPNKLDEEGLAGAQAGPVSVVIYRVEDSYYATSLMCTHGEASLADGYLDGFVIECPFHQGQFDIRTGEAVAAPCYEPIRTYPVRLADGILEVDVPDVDCV